MKSKFLLQFSGLVLFTIIILKSVEKWYIKWGYIACDSVVIVCVFILMGMFMVSILTRRDR